MIKEEGPEWFHNLEARAVSDYYSFFFFLHITWFNSLISLLILHTPLIQNYPNDMEFGLNEFCIGYCFIFVSSATHACSAPLLDFTKPTCLRWHPRQKTAQLERSSWCSAPPPSSSPLERSTEQTLLCSSSSADHHLPAGEWIWGRGGERYKDS